MMVKSRTNVSALLTLLNLHQDFMMEKNCRMNNDEIFLIKFIRIGLLCFIFFLYIYIYI